MYQHFLAWPAGKPNCNLLAMHDVNAQGMLWQRNGRLTQITQVSLNFCIRSCRLSRKIGAFWELGVGAILGLAANVLSKWRFLSQISWKLSKVGTWDVLQTDRKSYMSFHFLTWPLTFDDLERSNLQKMQVNGPYHQNNFTYVNSHQI